MKCAVDKSGTYGRQAETHLPFIPLYCKAPFQKKNHHDIALFSMTKGVTRCHVTHCVMCGEPLEYSPSGDEKYPNNHAFLFHSREKDVDYELSLPERRLSTHLAN
jgi:hypothetical protein